MLEVCIHFQEGFDDDSVEVWSGQARVLKLEHLSTSKLIGLARTEEVHLAEETVTLEIRFLNRDLKRTITLDPRKIRHVAVSLESGQLVVRLSETPFGYA